MTKKKSLGFSYIRFSTPEQMRGDSYNRQLQRTKDYCQKHNIELSPTEFKDLGISGRRLSARKGLQLLLEKIKSGVIPSGSIIICESFDRLTRSSIDEGLRLVLEIIKSCDLVMAGEKEFVFGRKNSNDIQSIMVCLMELSRSSAESDRKSDLIHNGWESKKENIRTALQQLPSYEEIKKSRGNPRKELEEQVRERIILTSQPPWWLEIHDKRPVSGKKHYIGKYYVKPDCETTINHIVELSVSGFSDLEITRDLNKNKGKFVTFEKGWNTNKVRRLLVDGRANGLYTPNHVFYVEQKHIDNKDYLIDGKPIGYEMLDKQVKIPGKPIPDYFPKVISDENQKIILMKREERRIKKYGRTGINFGNIFRKMCVCGHCGNSVRLNPKGKKKPHHKESKSLICNHAKTGRGCSQVKPINYNIAEHNILLHCKYLDVNYFSRGKSEGDRGVLDHRIEQKKVELYEITEEGKKLKEQIKQSLSKNGRISSMLLELVDEYEDKQIKIKGALDKLINERDVVKIKSENESEIKEKLSSLLNEVQSENSKELRIRVNDYLKSFIDKIAFFIDDVTGVASATIVFKNGEVRDINIDKKLPESYKGWETHDFELTSA